MSKAHYPQSIVEPYNRILQSSIFRLDGEDIDLTATLTELANAVHAADDLPEGIWSGLGEFSAAPLGDLIAAAYWSVSEWYNGQWSPEYAALCALGNVFKPGPCCNGPEPETCEADAYTAFNEYFNDKFSKAS